MDLARAGAQPPLDRVVAALIDLGGSLSQIVGHMTEHQRRTAQADGTDTVPIPDVLAPLLADVLRDAARPRSPEAVADVADFLTEASRLIGDEILLVPLDPPEGNRAERRRRR